MGKGWRVRGKGARLGSGGGTGGTGEGWAGGSEVLTSWHACKKTSLLSKQHCRGSLHLARIGAALLQSLVLHLLEREVRIAKKEMVWMGVEGCTHVETISAPTLADVHVSSPARPRPRQTHATA